MKPTVTKVVLDYGLSRIILTVSIFFGGLLFIVSAWWIGAAILEWVSFTRWWRAPLLGTAIITCLVLSVFFTGGLFNLLTKHEEREAIKELNRNEQGITPANLPYCSDCGNLLDDVSATNDNSNVFTCRSCNKTFRLWVERVERKEEAA